MSVVTKTSDNRPARQGKIKWAHKVTRNGKTFPERLQHYRFTSPDRTALEALAEVYGGEVSDFDDPAAAERNQYQLYSESDDIGVWIVPGQMYKGYEDWRGGVCMRRCDGETADVLTPNPDGDEYVPHPCMCDAAGELVCKPKVRASFILPEAPMGGTWMIESSAWEVWRGMPALSELLELMQGGSSQLQPARLVLTERSKKVKVGGKTQTRRWSEPKLVLPATPNQIIAGEAGVMSNVLPGRPVSIATPTPLNELAPTDVIEAEVIEDAQIIESGEKMFPTKAAAIAAGHSNSDITKIGPGQWQVL